MRDRYPQAKERLLYDPSICSENRVVIARFFEFEEYKLKRQNGLPDLDEGCCKTLYGYIIRFRNVNQWFGNKPWSDLTREDIKRVYDALEDGTIRNRAGLQFQDRHSYYNKVFKSKPFRLVGKADLARDVIEFSTRQHPEVRFLTEETFRRLAGTILKPTHALLVWLAWDIGENINSLLQLVKRDFSRQPNRSTGEAEYVVRLDQHKLKRSRKARSEITLYPETAALLDRVLPTMADDDLLFHFGYRYAAETLATAVKVSGAATQPHNAPVRFKDLRSGMACHLLRSGWTRDEVNARLGHTPHSDALDAYINFLALDREGPKERMLLAAGRGLSPAAVAEAAPASPGTTPRAEVSSGRSEVEFLTAEVERLRRLILESLRPSVAS